jgi:hypothetical protein
MGNNKEQEEQMRTTMKKMQGKGRIRRRAGRVVLRQC